MAPRLAPGAPMFAMPQMDQGHTPYTPDRLIDWSTSDPAAHRCRTSHPIGSWGVQPRPQGLASFPCLAPTYGPRKLIFGQHQKHLRQAYEVMLTCYIGPVRARLSPAEK
jgi:hypothetical protein